MNLVIIAVVILIISFILAVRSMVDFEAPEAIKNILNFKRIKGSIVFFKHKIKHYQH